jgi:hypothetical protein
MSRFPRSSSPAPRPDAPGASAKVAKEKEVAAKPRSLDSESFMPTEMRPLAKGFQNFP